MPRKRPVSCSVTSFVTTTWESPRAAAMRGIWYMAPAIVISGSSPDPDVVTRSTGTGPGGAFGFSFFNRAICFCTFWISTLFVGPRLEAFDHPALYGCGFPLRSVVAEGRPWKYLGEVQNCPMSSDPMTCPLEVYTRLPLACE